jgi:hypothetical protein
MAARRNEKGISLAKGPVGILGITMIAYGVLAFLLGGANNFGLAFPNGPVEGSTFLGIENNGWTSLLWVAGGALLAFGAPMHWGAKSMAIVVGLALGAASVISMVDGNDVLGIFATNGLTELALGAVATALLLLSLLPRVRGRDRTRDEHRGQRDDTVRGERDGRFTREHETAEPRRERVVHGEHRDGLDDRHGERRVVAPADGDGIEDRRRL